MRVNAGFSRLCARWDLGAPGVVLDQPGGGVGAAASPPAS